MQRSCRKQMPDCATGHTCAVLRCRSVTYATCTCRFVSDRHDLITLKRSKNCACRAIRDSCGPSWSSHGYLVVSPWIDEVSSTGGITLPQSSTAMCCSFTRFRHPLVDDSYTAFKHSAYVMTMTVTSSAVGRSFVS